MDNSVLLVVSRLSSHFSSILSTTLRSTDQSNYIRKSGTTIRSSHNSKWQACMRETDADRSWQAGHGEPRTSKRDEQGRSNARHSCLVTALHSYLEAHVLAHASERVNSDSEGDASKVETQKTEAQCSCLHPQKKNKRDVFCERKSMVTWQQQSTKSSTNDVNLGTITDTLSWYKFSPLSAIRVKPKLHRRGRRIYDSSYSRRRSQK